MLIEFDEELELPVEAVYPYFRSPTDWPRLYGAFGEVRDRGEGWYAVPLRRFPFPLVARITRDEPLRCVEWELGGFWRGEGRVFFVPTTLGVTVRGHERISAGPPWLAALAERLLEQRFRAVWASGWRRLRRQGRTTGQT